MSLVVIIRLLYLKKIERIVIQHVLQYASCYLMNFLLTNKFMHEKKIVTFIYKEGCVIDFKETEINKAAQAKENS